MWEEYTDLKQPGAGGGLTDYQWGDGGVPPDGSDGLYLVWNRTTYFRRPMAANAHRTSMTRCPMNTAVMNCDNYKGVYSFHPGGCNIVFGDGSVQFIKDDVSADTFVSLITRGAADQTGTDF